MLGAWNKKERKQKQNCDCGKKQNKRQFSQYSVIIPYSPLLKTCRIHDVIYLMANTEIYCRCWWSCSPIALAISQYMPLKRPNKKSVTFKAEVYSNRQRKGGLIHLWMMITLWLLRFWCNSKSQCFGTKSNGAVHGAERCDGSCSGGLAGK